MQKDVEQSRKRTRAAVGIVCSDPDLVALILRRNIGVSTWGNASLVCKEWLSVCRGDEGVLRGAALYTGGLTKGAFLKLFAVPLSEVAMLPHTMHRRYGGGSYFLYGQAAVDTVLAGDDAMAVWYERLRRRGATGSPPWASVQSMQPVHRFHSAAAQEEYLRKRMVHRQQWQCTRACG